MNKKKLHKAVSEWATVMTEMIRVMKDLRDHLGVDIESPLSSATNAMMEAYTASISKSIVDTDNMLEWFWLENDMGKKGMACKLAHWDDFRPIKTVDELVNFLIGRMMSS